MECREAMSVTAVKGTSENVWVTDGGENAVTDNKRKTQCLFFVPIFTQKASAHSSTLHVGGWIM